jgi:hypothetical protein
LRKSRYELNLVYFEGYCVVSVILERWKMMNSDFVVLLLVLVLVFTLAKLSGGRG